MGVCLHPHCCFPDFEILKFYCLCKIGLGGVNSLIVIKLYPIPPIIDNPSIIYKQKTPAIIK